MKAIPAKALCSASVHDGGRSVSFHQCVFKGVLNYMGKLYCRKHYPPNVETKDKARKSKWQAEWDRPATIYKAERKEQNTLQRKARAYDRLLTYLKQQQTAWGPGDPNLPLSKVRAVLTGKKSLSLVRTHKV